MKAPPGSGPALGVARSKIEGKAGREADAKLHRGGSRGWSDSAKWRGHCDSSWMGLNGEAGWGERQGGQEVGPPKYL